MADPRPSRGTALLGLALALVPIGAFAEDFVCRGRDPGWELVGEGTRAVLQPESGSRKTFTGGTSTLSAEGVVVWRGHASAGEPDLVAVMLRGACTDPGAGEPSTHLGIVSLPNAKPAVGCCSYGARPAMAALDLGASRAEAAENPDLKVAPAVADAEPAPAVVQAKPEPPKPPVAAPAATAPRKLAAGSTVKIAGSKRRTVNLRTKPGSGRVIAKLPGGRSVIVQQTAQAGGDTWYRVRGRGVPANAWVRGDLLVGG